MINIFLSGICFFVFIWIGYSPKISLLLSSICYVILMAVTVMFNKYGGNDE